MQKKKVIGMSLLAGAVLVLAGCAETTVYPIGNGRYSLVSTSSSQGYAEKYAKKKAAKVCSDKGKQLLVVSHKTVYQGVEKKDAAIIGVAGALVGDAGAGQSNDDYKTTLIFKCT